MSSDDEGNETFIIQEESEKESKGHYKLKRSFSSLIKSLEKL